MKTLKTTLFLTLLTCFCTLSAQSISWTEQIINDRSENLQDFTQAEDGSATIVGYGNTFVKSTDGGETWNNTGVFETDAFDYQDISFSGNTGFAVAMTGYKVIDRGANDIYANSPLLKTVDGGVTWELITVANMGSGSDSTLNLSAAGNYSVKFTAVEAVDENTVYVAAYWKDVKDDAHYNVFNTTDGGATWEPVIPHDETAGINSMLTYNEHIYIAGNKTLYKVSVADNIVTDLYPVVDKGEDDGMYFWNISVSGNELIFPTTADSIRITNDEGTTFTSLPNIKKGYYVYKHDENNIVVAAGSSDTKTTNDGGATWTTVSAGESLWNGAIVGDSLIAIAKNEIYTMAISDIAAGTFAWTSKIITDISGNLKGITTTGDKTFITGYSDIFLMSTDGAQTFTEVNLPSKSDIIYGSLDLDFVSIAQGKGGAQLASSRRIKTADYDDVDVYISGFLISTTDNWESFDVIDDTNVGAKYTTTSTNPYAEGCYGQDYYTGACVDDSTFMTYVQWYDTISGDDKITYGRVFKSTDAGESWDTISSDFGGLYIESVVEKDGVIYIGGNKTLIRSTDNGLTYENLNEKLTALGATDPYINDIIIKGDTLYIPTISDGVYVSYDAGASFSAINGVSGATAIVPVDGDSWMTLGSSAKCFFSNNAGTDWIDVYPGSTVYSTGGIYNGNIIALCKAKIFKQSISGLEADASAINELNLSENTIAISQIGDEITLTSEQNISNCNVYSITGQIVLNATPQSTNYLLNTSHFTSGIYLISTVVNGQSITHKVIIK